MKIIYTDKELEDLATRVAEIIKIQSPTEEIFNKYLQTYDIDEVALITSKNPQTIRLHCRLKKLEGKRAGGSWIVSQEALDKYIGKL